MFHNITKITIYNLSYILQQQMLGTSTMLYYIVYCTVRAIVVYETVMLMVQKTFIKYLNNINGLDRPLYICRSKQKFVPF
jgi:hypothetical protein